MRTGYQEGDGAGRSRGGNAAEIFIEARARSRLPRTGKGHRGGPAIGKTRRGAGKRHTFTLRGPTQRPSWLGYSAGETLASDIWRSATT